MTDTTYRDGDLAMITIKATWNRTRAVRVAMPQGMQWMTLPSGSFFNDAEVSDADPLITLDPADADGDRHRVAAALGSWWETNRSEIGMASGTGHTAGVALQAAGHMLNYLATPPADATPPEQAVEPEKAASWNSNLGPIFVYKPPRNSIDVLDEILVELRRIGDGIARISAGTRLAAPARRTEVTHASAGVVTEEPPRGSLVKDKHGHTWARSTPNGKWHCRDCQAGNVKWTSLVKQFGPLTVAEIGGA